MKLAIVLVAVFCAAVLARPQNPQDVQILKYDNDNIGIGNYRFEYALSDGQEREETGELKNAGSENEALVARGSYKFVLPDGKTVSVTYVSDENGYQPVVSIS